MVEILRCEGGYTDHPSDPGGATNLGISLRFAQDIALDLDDDGDTDASDIRLMDISKATELYRKHFWDACSCDNLPHGIDLLVFDIAVNQGVGSSKRLLQSQLEVTVDGVVGPKTLEAVRAAHPLSLLLNLTAKRILRYERTANFETFGEGWINRSLHIYNVALGLAEDPSYA